VLDEPTTGLHFDDVRKLLDVLHRLVDLGNTVVVVEHNLDVIKTADWVIDLGPEAGEAGGYLVAEGPPEQIARTPASHTGAILAEVLAAGPHTRRQVFDPTAALAPQQGDVPLEAVGKDVAPPWELDGAKWHTQDRLSFHGTPCKWEGATLPWALDKVHQLGPFSPTDWNNRTVVEVAAATKSLGWFLHAMTGGERLLRLVFRVGRNTFKAETLTRSLGIAPLNRTEGVGVYGDEDRVRVANRRGPWQEVTLLVHRKEEIDTPAFDRFLRKAAESFHANIGRMRSSPEDVMPWKVNGERWHLGEKGFPPGQRVRWDHKLLPKLLDLVRGIVPTVEVKWDVRDSISFRAAARGPVWSRWWTKRPGALECQFFGPKGRFNLSRIEDLGHDPEIVQEKEGGDVITLRFLTTDQVTDTRLRAFLTEQAGAVATV
jgi:excinuclease ABC subunit A